MFLKELERNILNKKVIVTILILSLLLLSTFLLKKANYFYELTNYITEYLKYYTNNYLSSINELIASNKIWLFVEYDVVNIYSSTFIYFLTQDTFIFLLLTLLMPIIIYIFINSYVFEELYSKFYKNVIHKIGKKRYIFSRLFISSFLGGLIALIPKLIYLGFLKIFFVNSFSTTHYLNNTSLIPNKYLFFQNNFTPTSLLISDLCATFIYGVIIALISILIISLSNRKVLSYIIFMFIIYGQTVIAVIFSNVLKLNILTPFINMYSVPDFLFYNNQNSSVTFLIMQYGFILILISLITFNLYRKRVENLL